MSYYKNCFEVWQSVGREGSLWLRKWGIKKPNKPKYAMASLAMTFISKTVRLPKLLIMMAISSPGGKKKYISEFLLIAQYSGSFFFFPFHL